jgi:hypothetical protein
MSTNIFGSMDNTNYYDAINDYNGAQNAEEGARQAFLAKETEANRRLKDYTLAAGIPFIDNGLGSVKEALKSGVKRITTGASNILKSKAESLVNDIANKYGVNFNDIRAAMSGDVQSLEKLKTKLGGAKYEELKNQVQSKLEALKSEAQKKAEDTAKQLSTAGNDKLNETQKALDAYKEKGKSLLKEGQDKIGQKLTEAQEKAGQTIEDIKAQAEDAKALAKGTLSEAEAGAKASAREALSSAKGTVSEAQTSAKSALSDAQSSAKSALSDAQTSARSGISQISSESENARQSLENSLKQFRDRTNQMSKLERSEIRKGTKPPVLEDVENEAKSKLDKLKGFFDSKPQLPGTQLRDQLNLDDIKFLDPTKAGEVPIKPLDFSLPEESADYLPDTLPSSAAISEDVGDSLLKGPGIKSLGEYASKATGTASLDKIFEDLRSREPPLKWVQNPTKFEPQPKSLSQITSEAEDLSDQLKPMRELGKLKSLEKVNSGKIGSLSDETLEQSNKLLNSAGKIKQPSLSFDQPITYAEDAAAKAKQVMPEISAKAEAEESARQLQIQQDEMQAKAALEGDSQAEATSKPQGEIENEAFDPNSIDTGESDEIQEKSDEPPEDTQIEQPKPPTQPTESDKPSSGADADADDLGDLGKAAAESSEIDADLGGPGDEVGDVISLIAGLGTVIGGAIDGESDKPPPVTLPNPTSVFGV